MLVALSGLYFLFGDYTKCDLIECIVFILHCEKNGIYIKR